MSSRRRSSGFTLLELLVVLAIFGVFALMAYGGLDAVLTSRARVEEAMDQTAVLQKAYVRLREDFQQVRNRPIRDGFGDVQPAFRSVEREGRVEFTRGGWRNPLLLPRPSLERVSYRLDRGKLTRESWRVLDQAQDSAPVQLVLLDDVERLEWRFLDAERQWQTRWPVETGGTADRPPAPPIAIEIVLESRRWGPLRFLFRLGPDAPRAPQGDAS